MKLGIRAVLAEESFRKARERGLDFVEFCITVKNDASTLLDHLEDIKDWMNKYKVGVGSIGRWGYDVIDDTGRVMTGELEDSKRFIDAASFLGCRNFVCGCNYVEGLSYYQNCTAAITLFSRLLDYGKKKNVRVASYNCRWNNFIHSEPAWTVIHGHLKELGIKYDPSHCYYSGGDYLQEAADWGKRFYHVHIKGGLMVGGERFDDPPAGLDAINWGAFLSILYNRAYKDGLSIEPHSKTWRGELGEEGVDYTVEYLKKMVFRR